MKILKMMSKCECGKPYSIEFDSKWSVRADGKRISPPGSLFNHNQFRCSECHRVVDESVKGAYYQ